MWYVCFNRAPREVGLAKTLTLKIIYHHTKRTQWFDPHFIAKGSDVKKQVSIAEVKVTGFLAKHNLPLATGPLPKSIFPDSNIAKELNKN